ncbi:type I-E CRISPR-associated protein Cas5/CasD [Actinokineospora iranica]|uniref:CRISPR-associated protein, Cas5e family n=1 Tax=Actinokineospora iranica TaxID=1271860 RepID=A0A1G6N8T4_9PSEU|nr:type I-E CRISPR-associated protein Cas5/CasD [Actinokineospora iranica]SDC64272.1 CRISPR-associated protein, Cas5e family [Actinokineospora iranica]
MTVLLLRFAAPMQSWGTSSRFVRRNTDRMPSKSGVIGLLAAAQGRRRVDPIEDLVGLRVGVRVDQPGRVERDFQTARTRDGSQSMPLSYRFYLADAVFAVAVEGEATLVEGLREALRRPVFPLFLGRRSCPPVGRLDHELYEGGVEQVLSKTPWLAAKWTQRAHADHHVRLATVIDCPPGTPGSDVVRDEPISFDPRRREYGWRSVIHGRVTVPNPAYDGGFTPGPDPHDPMGPLGDGN